MIETDFHTASTGLSGAFCFVSAPGMNGRSESGSRLGISEMRADVTWEEKYRNPYDDATYLSMITFDLWITLPVR